MKSCAKFTAKLKKISKISRQPLDTFFPFRYNITILCLLRLVVRTSGFHPDNSGSIPLGDANFSLTFFQNNAIINAMRRSYLKNMNSDTPPPVMADAW